MIDVTSFRPASAECVVRVYKVSIQQDERRYKAKLRDHANLPVSCAIVSGYECRDSGAAIFVNRISP